MGALSEAYRDNPLNLHQIVPLDFGSVQTVPDSHDWADQKSDDHHYSSAVPVSVPVIELTDPGAPELIREACEKWGMFQLTGHGVPEKLMEDVEAETRRLFGLSADQKLKALRSPGGASGYGLPQISHFFSKRMWHEGFTIIGSPVHHAKLLWPHHYQPFCETIEAYQIQMKLLAEQLIRIIVKSFEEAANWFETTTKDESAEGGSNSSSSACNIALQMNSYPACPDPTRTMGLAPHTDTSLMTIVQQTKISGLQIFKEGVGWVLVQPVPGALTVNLGDFLHILSNGRFPSIRHRVLVSPIQRTSVAFFYSPPTDFVVSPLLSKDSGPGQVSRYRSVTVNEYVNIKAKHLQNSLSFIET